jgi:hypothetical protein
VRRTQARFALVLSAHGQFGHSTFTYSHAISPWVVDLLRILTFGSLFCALRCGQTHPNSQFGHLAFAYLREISPSVTYLSRNLTFGTKKARRAPTTPDLHASHAGEETQSIDRRLSDRLLGGRLRRRAEG